MPRLILAGLLLESGRVVSAERLVMTLWGADAGSRAVATLQVHVSNLRRSLEPAAARLGHDVIETVDPGYRLRLGVASFDLANLEAAVRHASDDATDASEALEELESVLDASRGEPLEDVADGHTLDADLQRVRELYWSARTASLRTRLRIGHDEQLLPELARLVVERPLDEQLRAIQMVALYRAGQQAASLAAYEECRGALVGELGVDPSPALADLHTRILRHDPELATPAASAASDEVETVLRTVSGHVGQLQLPDGTTVALDRVVTTVGRRSDRQVVLDDPDVSRVHAELRREGTTYVLLDAGSANGCYVNEQRTVESRLSDGDEIRLGTTTMQFRQR